MAEPEEKPTNIRLIGGILAVALMVGGYVLHDTYGPGADLRGTETIETDLLAKNPVLFGAFKARFPASFADFVQQTQRLMDSGANPETLNASAETFMTEFRRQNGPILMRANPQEIRELVTMSRDLHGKLRAELGRSRCNDFAIRGPAALGDDISPHLETISQQGAMLITAMANARTRPPYAALEPATEENWQTAIALMARTVGTEADSKALRSADAGSDLCQAVVRLLETIDGMDNELGARLRATFARDLAVN